MVLGRPLCCHKLCALLRALQAIMYVARLLPVQVEVWVTEAAWVIHWHGHGRRYATERGWESGIVRSESENAGGQ